LTQWAADKGVLLGKGVSWIPTIEGDEEADWNIGLDGEAQTADRVLFIPRDIIFNSLVIEQGLRESIPGWKNATEYITSRHCDDQLAQYCLWIQILLELDRGVQSQWYPWIQSLPRTFSNALYMDMVELDYLPPYAWSLAKLQLLHLQVFPSALKLMPTVVSMDTLQNKELHKWALSVVFTRCWGVEDGASRRNDNAMTAEDSTATKCCHLAPIGDMLNHAENATTALDYDVDGNCQFFLKRDMGGPPIAKTTLPHHHHQQCLSLSYGRTTNPSRFLVLYGFVDTTQRYIFSQLLVTNPTIQHKNMGYNVDRMTIDTMDGSLADEIWDVALYSILEQVPLLQEEFYAAHGRNDTVTKHAIQQQYQLETSLVLKNHIDGKVAELEALLIRMDDAMTTGDGSSRLAFLHEQHPRFFLIRQHNIFVYQTFVKAKRRLDHRIQLELEQRKQEEIQKMKPK
jgi:hypothetical protein